MTNFQEFIDIHTHILPGLDDGPKDLQGSLAIACCYERAGIRRVVATPHFLPGTAWAASRDKVSESVKKLQNLLDSENVALQVEAGMEIAYHKKLEERICSNSLLPLGGSGYFLIEPSFHGEQDGLSAKLSALLSRGCKLILAHPERVDTFQQQPDRLIKLVEMGLRIQVNAGSLLGKFGRKSKGTAELLHQRNCLHFLASDAHDHEQRAPLTITEWQQLLNCLGEEKLTDYCARDSVGIFSAT